MKKVKWYAALTGLLLGSAALAGCGSSSATASSQNKPLKIAYLAPSLDISYWQWVWSGVQQEAKKLHATAVEYNANNSPATQMSNAQAAITAGANAIVIGPVSSSSVPPLLQLAQQHHIPVSFAGIGPNPGVTNFTSAVTANNYNTGIREGRYICEAAKKLGSNKVGVLSLPLDRENARAYLKGAKQSFSQYGCTVSQILQTHGLTVREAVQEASDMLTAHPNIRGIYGMYDEAGTGAAEVLKTLHKVGKIALATADGSPTTIKLLHQGVIQAIFLQEAVGQGIDATKEDVLALAHPKKVQHEIPLYEPMVTLKNINTPQIQKVLRLTYPPSAGSY